jgi:hypothetical protein
MDSGPVLQRVVDKPVGNLGRGLIPADALPLAFPAFADTLHRIEHALLAIHVLGVTQTLLAATGTIIGRIVARAAILALLLLAPDDAALYVNVHRAVAGAVQTAAAVDHLVPGPLLAHQVFPATIDRVGGRLGNNGRRIFQS